MSVRNPAVSSRQARILLVDGNSNGLKARKTLLEELGYQIAAASSTEDAIESFAAQKFDLVITDYKTPRTDGLELIARLRKKSAAVPIILISGYADALGLCEENTGADAVIQKSAHEVAHLARAVARLLRQRKPPAGETRPKAKRKTV